jgi:hypothetical protein
VKPADKENDMAKTMTEQEFISAAKNATIKQDYEMVSCDERFAGYTDDGDDILQNYIWGFIWREIEIDGWKITYQEGFDYPEFKSSEVSISGEGLDNLWQFDGETLHVIDANGDEIEKDCLCDILLEETDIDDFDSSQFGDDETEEVDNDNDNDKENDMKEYIVQRSNAADLRFNGEIVAHTESSANNASGSSYSGQTGRWSELTLYKTAGGKFVCEQIGRTQWQGEHTRYSGAVCETAQEVIAFFGHGWLAKDLYEIAEIEDIEEVK